IKEFQRDIARSLAADHGPETLQVQAVAYALQGQEAKARAVADDLSARRKLDVMIQSDFLPALTGLLDLRANKPADAVEAMKTSTSYDGMDTASMRIRAEAY